jgi:hypothetical protein
MTKFNSNRKQEMLRQHLHTLYEDQEAVYRQLSFTLSEIDRIRLQRQLDNLNQQIQNLEQTLCVSLVSDVTETNNVVLESIRDKQGILTSKEKNINLTKGESIRLLRQILATLYPTVEDSNRVISDAELNPKLVKFSEKAINNWQNILSEAEKQGKIDTIAQIASEEYPNDFQLIGAYEKYKIATDMLLSKPS